MTISGTYCGRGIGRQAGTQPKAGSPRRLRNPSRGSFHVHAQARASRFDPTHTTTIRDRFARMIVSRLKEFARMVRESVEVNDCLGLTATPLAVGLVPKTLQAFKPAMRNQFNFATSDEKLREFGKWMKRMAKSKVLGVESIDKVNPKKDDPWFGQVITSAYKKGIARAYDEMNKRKVTTGIDPKNPRQIDAALTAPVHAERVALIYSRVYNELDGVTDAMATQMSRTLAEGLADGLGPRQIARNLLDTVDGELEMVDKLGRTIPAKRRAVMIARTEVIRAHHKGMIGTYKAAGIEGVEVKAEWLTAGDDRVCDDCKDMEGRVFTLAKAEGLIPLHVQCRCVALPKVEGFGAEDFEMEDVEEA